MNKMLCFAAGLMMVAGGAIQASAAETNSIPEGISVSPNPGSQTRVNMITFCVNSAPGFANLVTSSLPGNYITVTSPEGESKDVSLYVLPTEASNTGNFYANPAFTAPGVWTVTTHFSTIRYMNSNLSYIDLPEACKEFTFTYTVRSASQEPESPYSPVPEGAVWSEKGPGTYYGGFTGKAVIDLSEIYSSIALSNPSGQAMLLTEYGTEYESLPTTWLNDEHTKLQITFNSTGFMYRQYGTFYIALPTGGTATLIAGGTEKLKNIKAGPWIRKKTETVPTVRSITPSGTLDISSQALPKSVVFKWQSYSGINVKFANPLDNMTVTDPAGKVTQLPTGRWDDWNTQFTYTLPDGWYTGLGEYTFSFSYDGMSGDSESYSFIFPEEPYTWNLIVVEPGVSPDAPEIEITGAELSANGAGYIIYEGTPANVTLTTTNPDAAIYYRWVPDKGTAEDFTEYTAPLSFEEDGKLQYYAKLKESTAQSGISEVNFFYYRLIPNSDFSITPVPGKYDEWTGDEIVVDYTGDELRTGLRVLNGNDIMTITSQNGESKQYTATVSTENPYQITFNVGGEFETPGSYKVSIDFEGFSFSMTDGNSGRILPLSFTYDIDVETGIGLITGEVSASEYYDLTGRRVSGKLMPGIYVVKENGKVTKRLIK